MMTDTSAFYQRLGQRIRTARQATGHTQTDLAACVGYGRCTSISDIEKGKTSLPVHILIAIADALGTDLYALLEEA